jgi:curved DNA-binding protein CbpA
MQPRLLPYSPERDIYRLLEVQPGASNAEVIEACRRLARTFHPDRNGSPRATQEMQVVNAVRGLITDPQGRAAYDHARRRWWATAHEQAERHARPDFAALGSARPSGASWRRTARAVFLGLRAALAALAPLRCEACRAVVGSRDGACASCGRLLLPGGSPDRAGPA